MITISSMRSPSDVDAFRRISTEWIERLFALEDHDRRVLDDPLAAVVATGGDVLVARDGTVSVGCVALCRYGDDLELAKMGVVPAAQGRGVGRLLVDAALVRARELGAARVFLGTNSDLAAALSLYRRAGFTPVDVASLPLAYPDRVDTVLATTLSAGAHPGGLADEVVPLGGR